MSSICNICTQSITKKSPGLKCVGVCGATYHANSTCSDVSRTQLGIINSLPGGKWECSNCRINTNDSESAQCHRTTSPPIRQSTSDDEGDYANAPEFKTLAASLKNGIEVLRESVEFCSNKISDFERKLAKLDDYFRATEQIKIENNKLKSEIEQLHMKINSIEKYNRLNNIEIHDIPEKNNENLVAIVKKIGEFIRCPVSDENINTVFRTQTQNKNKPKNIVVKFLSKHTRDNFLNAARSMRKQQKLWSGFALENISEKFFINEHLCTDTKNLLREVREKAKCTGQCKYIWIQNGNILARKNDNSKIVLINNLSDFNKI